MSRTWGKKGSRPRAVKQGQFKSSYLFGAVCPRKKKGRALVLPFADKDMVDLHLKEIFSAVTRGYHAVVVMDQASWHKAKDLVIPRNMTLVHLPPYSPELNPMEQVFQQLRKLKLSNACYKNHDEINQACVEAWNSFVENPDRIKNLCMRSWANVC